MKYSVIIPAHDEEKRIVRTLQEYGTFFKNLDTEIIVVLNGCTDHTLEVVQGFETIYPNIRHLDFIEGGKGFAITEGIRAATGDIIGFSDADNSTEPVEFHKLLTILETDSSIEGVIGSRWLPGSIVEPKQPLVRRFAGRVFNLMNRIMFLMPYKDTQAGCKVFRNKAAKEVVPDLSVTSWAWDTNILYSLKKRGYKVIEVPIVWHDIGGSKLNIFRTPIRMFLSLLRVRLLYSPFSFIITKVYDKIPEKWRVHHYI